MHDHGDGRWRLDGVRVVRSSELDINTAQTPGMNRAAAITHARAGAEKLWAGTVVIHPKAKTGAHHHGPVESVIYVVSGKARMRWGDRLEFLAEAGPGDFIYVPPFVPHQEITILRAGAQRPRAGRGQSRSAERRGESGNGRMGRRPSSAAQRLAYADLPTAGQDAGRVEAGGIAPSSSERCRAQRLRVARRLDLPLLQR
jgi:uncharacterized RmlC-like cupin family protein